MTIVQQTYISQIYIVKRQSYVTFLSLIILWKAYHVFMFLNM